MTSTIDDDIRKLGVEEGKFDVEDVQVERASSSSSSMQCTEFVVTDEERRLVRKLDMRIMPILSIVYLFACKSSIIMRFR